MRVWETRMTAGLETGATPLWKAWTSVPPGRVPPLPPGSVGKFPAFSNLRHVFCCKFLLSKDLLAESSEERT